MHVFRLSALSLQLAAAAALAGEPIPAETAGRTPLPEPQPSWFIASDQRSERTRKKISRWRTWASIGSSGRAACTANRAPWIALVTTSLS